MSSRLYQSSNQRVHTAESELPEQLKQQLSSLKPQNKQNLTAFGEVFLENNDNLKVKRYRTNKRQVNKCEMIGPKNLDFRLFTNERPAEISSLGG